MSEQIINKVQKSGLIQLDLADFEPKIELIGIDFKEFLFDELILKERDYRLKLDQFPWEMYSNKAVFIFCSVEAIIPAWAYMLLNSKLSEYVHFSMIGSESELQKIMLMEEINKVDFSQFSQKKIIIKGCSKLYQSEFALTYLTHKLKPVVASLMFGEPCSTVPIFKKKNESK